MRAAVSTTVKAIGCTSNAPAAMMASFNGIGIGTIAGTNTVTNPYSRNHRLMRAPRARPGGALEISFPAAGRKIEENQAADNGARHCDRRRRVRHLRNLDSE